MLARDAERAPGSRGISCFVVPKDTTGLSFGKPEQKMGLRPVPTISAHDDAYIPADRRVGKDGQGLQIAFNALDSGRLASPQSPLASPGGLRWTTRQRSGASGAGSR